MIGNKMETPEIELPANYDELHWTEKKQVREQYIKLQDGKCYYCGISLIDTPRDDIMLLKIHPELYPPNFFKAPVHLHHDHNTGKTIGAVHNHCNAVLWEYLGE